MQGAKVVSENFRSEVNAPSPAAVHDAQHTATPQSLMKPSSVTSTNPRDLSGEWRMDEVLQVFPSAHRALLRKYQIYRFGGRGSSGFQPGDSLATVAKNYGVDLDEVTEHIKRSQERVKHLEITPRETADLLKEGKIKLLDLRAAAEANDTGSIPGSMLVDQILAQEIIQSWPRDTPIAMICHHGIRTLDAADYLRGYGFANAKSMSGGIDAWSLDVDPSVPRY